MKVYDWCFFFEDGTKNYLYLPFGPESTDENKHANLISNLEDEWMLKVFEVYPYAADYLRIKPFAVAIVNPPEDATEDHVWEPEVMDWMERNDDNSVR